MCETTARSLPQQAGFLARSLGWASHYLEEMHTRRVARSGLQEMRHLDDHLLRDIGLTQDDVYWASQIPNAQEAADELNKIAMRGTASRR